MVKLYKIKEAQTVIPYLGTDVVLLFAFPSLSRTISPHIEIC